MKKLIFSALIIFTLISCKKNEENQIVVIQNDYSKFGVNITANNAITKEDLLEKYKTLKEGDTIIVKVASKIEDVCQKKGCWMNLELSKEESALVKFKDYGFFIPLNSAKSDVIINGKAFVSIESVTKLRHYAKDAGKSQAAIDSIKEQETTYSFEADGVLIKK